MKVTRNENGEFNAYAWPGGYPIFYATKDGSALCAPCANNENGSDAYLDHPCEVLPMDDQCDHIGGKHLCGNDAQWEIIAMDINYEDPDLWCGHCNERIESAYAEDQADAPID